MMYVRAYFNFSFAQDMKQMDRVYKNGKDQEIEDGQWRSLLCVMCFFGGRISFGSWLVLC